MIDVISVFERLPALFNAYPSLVRRASGANARLLIEAGNRSRRLVLDCGALRVETTSGPMDSWDIALRGDDQVWLDHWSDMPAPDAADILGMRRGGRLVVEGNFLPLMRHLQLIKDILVLPRGTL